jgi:hypothetical protein
MAFPDPAAVASQPGVSTVWVARSSVRLGRPWAGSEKLAWPSQRGGPPRPNRRSTSKPKLPPPSRSAVPLKPSRCLAIRPVCLAPAGREDCRQRLCSSTISSGDRVRVDVQGRGRASVTEALGHGHDGNPRRQHLARHEVAQVMEPKVRQPRGTPGSDEPLRQPVRQPGLRAVWTRAEHERAICQLRANVPDLRRRRCAISTSNDSASSSTR